MRLSVDMRSDLKRLSDEELAIRLDAALTEGEMLGDRSRWAVYLHPWWRGPIRHRAAYQSIALLWVAAEGAAYFWVPLLAMLGIKPLRRRVLDSREGRAYLQQCEALDLLDEAKRRVALRGRSAG